MSADTTALPTTRHFVQDILDRWRPGSGDWGWAEEFAQCIENEADALADLIRDMAANGFREPRPDEDPVLLGDDGRVWDGHHRIFAAFCCGFPAIPAAFGHGGAA